MVGAKVQSALTTTRVSTVVTLPILRTKIGIARAPRPMLWGKIVAPMMLELP